MPKNRRDVERDEKMAEIVGAAERRLRDGGYDALSVAGIARELGVAQNSIYWYFPTKDHLFVAVMERMVRDMVARKPKHNVDVIERIIWFTEQLRDIYDLRAAMFEQARTSEVVAKFATSFQQMIRRMLSNALSPYVNEEELPVAASTYLATVEGAWMQGLSKKERRQVLTFALKRLIGAHQE